MHELSIVMGIINIAEKEAAAAQASVVEEIELEIGTLSGIEITALAFAWVQAVRHTILEKAIRKIHLIEAEGRCLECNNIFKIEHYYDNCPLCNSHFFSITKGKELKVKSLIVS